MNKRGTRASKPARKRGTSLSSPMAGAPTSDNRKLEDAKKAKQDEFYTRLEDISNELRYYKAQLRGKVIFCNCDDPYESNFFKFFALNFNSPGLKKLIVTSYKKSPIVGRQLPLLSIEGLKPDGKEPYALEINQVPDRNDDGAIDLADVEFLLTHDANTSRPLKGDDEYNAGDFRSRECVALLKKADIVITNPPFSLFREYVAQLVEYGKRFLIIGNKNAITYKDVFQLIKENKLWIGAMPMGRDLLFSVPEAIAKTMVQHGKEGSKYKIINGDIYGRSSSIWFTNMDNPKRHEFITLYKTYSPDAYPTYANYNAIEVGKVVDIPVNYDGEIGVPITFLDKYNPEQFEIIGSSRELGTPISEIAAKGTYVQGGPRFYLRNQNLSLIHI